MRKTFLVAGCLLGSLLNNGAQAQCTMNTNDYQYRVVRGHYSNHNTSTNHINDMAMLRSTGTNTSTFDVLAGNGYDQYTVENYWSGWFNANTVTNRMVNGDFDNDGELDDVAALQDLGGGSTSIVVWRRQNATSFSAPVSMWSSGGYTATKTTGRVVSGDFDNDGYIDDIAAFYDYGGGQTRIHVWRGNGSSMIYQGSTGWWSTFGYTASRITSRVVSGDFDRDGKFDDIAAFYDYNGQTRIHVWKGNGSTFQYQWSTGWWTGGSYTAGRLTGRVVSGDFDSDGKYDDITGFYDYGNGTVRAHVWESTGSSFSYNGDMGNWQNPGGFTVSALTGRLGCVSTNNNWGYNFSEIIGVYNYGSNANKFLLWETKNPLFGQEYFQYSAKYLCTKDVEQEEMEEFVMKSAALATGELTIYPNPTKGELNISFGKETENAVVEVLDLTGRVILSEQANNMLVNYDISSMPNGTYIVRIINGEEVRIEKLILQK